MWQPLPADKVTPVADDAKAPKKQALERKMPLDGLRPTDFDASWPNGKFVVPPALKARDLSDEAVEHTVEFVKDMRRLVRDYEAYLQGKPTTQDAVARQIGVSSGMLASLRTGKSWSNARTVWILRRIVPTEADREAGALDRPKR